MGENRYLVDNVLTHREIISEQGALAVLMGNEKDHIATRVAYRLNLTGPALTVQTSCSTSLVAVHVGTQLLRCGDAHAVVVGGSALRPNPKLGYRYTRDGILSPDGYCRAFDASAQGTVPGAGAAVLVLRRLDDALADGDPIHAVIKGTAINNDGRLKIGYTAPSVDGQREVLTRALEDAGITSHDVDYVLTHGTGTPLGDAIEIEALSAVYGRERCDTPLLLGSLKPSIGHLDIAAGAINAVAASLIVSKGEIPPSIHCSEPNPAAVDAGLEIVTERRPFDGADRCVGVSSFGLGGTNAHIIFGSPPYRPPTPPSRRLVVVPVSARTQDGARAHQQRITTWNNTVPHAPRWTEVSATLRAGRVHHAWRSYAIAFDDGQHRSLVFTSPARSCRGYDLGCCFRAMAASFRAF